MPIENSNANARSRGISDAPAWAIQRINENRERQGLRPLACEGRPDDWPGFNAEQRLYNARRLAKIAMAETRNR